MTHIQNCERSHRTFRETILRRMNGCRPEKVPYLVSLLEFMANNTQSDSSIRRRFLVTSEALTRVMGHYRENGRTQVQRTFELPSMIEMSKEQGVNLLTESVVRGICEEIRPNSRLFNDVRGLITDQKIFHSYISLEGTIEGEVYSSTCSSNKTKQNSDEIPWSCKISFKEIKNTVEDFSVANLVCECTNPGCEMWRQCSKNKDRYPICKHAVATLFERVQKPGSKDLQDYIDGFKQKRFKYRIRKSNFQDQRRSNEDGYYIDQVLKRDGDEVLVKWYPTKLETGPLTTYKYGASLTWIKEEDIQTVLSDESSVSLVEQWTRTTQCLVSLDRWYVADD